MFTVGIQSIKYQPISKNSSKVRDLINQFLKDLYTKLDGIEVEHPLRVLDLLRMLEAGYGEILGRTTSIMENLEAVESLTREYKEGTTPINVDDIVTRRFMGEKKLMRENLATIRTECNTLDSIYGNLIKRGAWVYVTIWDEYEDKILRAFYDVTADLTMQLNDLKAKAIYVARQEGEE